MKRLIWNRHTKLLLKYIVGWFFIAVGLIMLVTPGQGILSLVIGIFLLADHVPFFGRIRDWIHRRFPDITDYVHRKGKQLQRRFHHGTGDGPNE